MKLPFWLLPTSWFLGSKYAVAKAHYELKGTALDIELAKIRGNGVILPEDELEIRKNRGDIDAYEYEKQHVAFEKFDYDYEKEIRLLDVEKKYHKIDDSAYTKAVSTAKNIPWVGIVNQGFDPSQGKDGLYFELDWNPLWIKYLKENGYQGYTDEQIIEQWFADVCAEGANVHPVNAPFGI